MEMNYFVVRIALFNQTYGRMDGFNKNIVSNLLYNHHQHLVVHIIYSNRENRLTEGGNRGKYIQLKIITPICTKYTRH